MKGSMIGRYGTNQSVKPSYFTEVTAFPRWPGISTPFSHSIF